jgi:hypothetical protein
MKLLASDQKVLEKYKSFEQVANLRSRSVDTNTICLLILEDLNHSIPCRNVLLNFYPSERNILSMIFQVLFTFEVFNQFNICRRSADLHEIDVQLSSLIRSKIHYEYNIDNILYYIPMDYFIVIQGLKYSNAEKDRKEDTFYFLYDVCTTIDPFVYKNIIHSIFVWIFGKEMKYDSEIEFDSIMRQLITVSYEPREEMKTTREILKSELFDPFKVLPSGSETIVDKSFHIPSKIPLYFCFQ